MNQLFKKYSVVRSKTKEVMEEFSTLEAAEAFMIMMQAKGESVNMVTKDEDADDAPTSYEIDGLELDEPTVEFGSDLDVFGEDYEEPDMEVDDDAPDVEIE